MSARHLSLDTYVSKSAANHTVQSQSPPRQRTSFVILRHSVLVPLHGKLSDTESNHRNQPPLQPA